MALLLFLVCFIVASVAISAATAASGRLAELREANQRYYSVNSAAGFVNDLISDNSWGQNRVTLTCSCVVDEETVPAEEGATGEVVYKYSNPREWKVAAEVGDDVVNDAATSMFLTFALDYLTENTDDNSLNRTIGGIQGSILDTALSSYFSTSGISDREKLKFDLTPVKQNVSSPKKKTYEPIYVKVSDESNNEFGYLHEVTMTPTLNVTDGDVSFAFTDSSYTLNKKLNVKIDASETDFEVVSASGGKSKVRVSTTIKFFWTGGAISI